LKPLRRFDDPRGSILHMLRSDDPHFRRFGEIYFSTVHAGAVKAWHLHRAKTVNLAVPVGCARIAVYDPRQKSPTSGKIDVIELGPDNYQLLIVPPGLWYGFKGIGQATTLVANCATLPFDPSEGERLPPDSREIPFNWDGA
jgi:dTDP-4-dehydrorhamnose 3,5-epimerase